jgi:hypothetical protein
MKRLDKMQILFQVESRSFIYINHLLRVIYDEDFENAVMIVRIKRNVKKKITFYILLLLFITRNVSTYLKNPTGSRYLE